LSAVTSRRDFLQKQAAVAFTAKRQSASSAFGI
jgi:hypothetical protein